MRHVAAPKLAAIFLAASLGLVACGGIPGGEAATPASATEAAPAATPLETSAPSAAEPTAPRDEPTDTPAPAEPTAPPEETPAPEPTAAPTDTPAPPAETREPMPTLVPLEVNSFPTGDTFGDELAFQTLARDPAAGGDNGAGIDTVTFRIVDARDQVVHERTERNALYCAFGGGDDLQNCDVWRFSEHDNKWPSGVAVESGGAYRLQVTVRAKSGQQTSQELAFTIQL